MIPISPHLAMWPRMENVGAGEEVLSARVRSVPRTNEELKQEERRVVEELEKRFVTQTLERHHGRVKDASDETGINRAMCNGPTPILHEWLAPAWVWPRRQAPWPRLSARRS